MEKIVVFLRGLPGSGKTTLVNELKKDIQKDYVVLSKDALRIDENGQYFFDRNKEKEVEKSFISQLKKSVEKEIPIIFIDNLNLSDNSIKKYIEICKDYFSISINFQAKDLIWHEKKNTKGIGYDELKQLKRNYKETSNLCDVNIDSNNKDQILKQIQQPHRNTTGKTSKAELELRIATVYEMVVKGANRPYILRYASENWNISERTVDNYLSEVYKRLKETFGEEYREMLSKVQVAKLNDLYQKNYTIEDFRECRNIIETINKMFGLNAPEKIEQTQNIKQDTPTMIVFSKKPDK